MLTRLWNNITETCSDLVQPVIDLVRPTTALHTSEYRVELSDYDFQFITVIKTIGGLTVSMAVGARTVKEVFIRTGSNNVVKWELSHDKILTIYCRNYWG